MTYIEQLQEDKRVLIDFFNAFNDLEQKQYKFENTAYRGDALKAVDAARATLNEIREQVHSIINRKTIKKEVVNA